MTKENDFDVVIVGGGLVGASLAIALADQPLKIAVIEVTPLDKNSTVIDQRAIALSLASARILKTIGVWEKIVAFAAEITRIHVSDQGHFGITHFDAHEQQLSAFGYVVSAGVLSKYLNETLAAQSSIKFFYETSLQNFEYKNNKVIIKIKDANGIQEFSSNLIVGADGTASKVRELANIKSDIYDYQQYALITQIGLSKDHQQIAYERFTKDGAIALLPYTKFQAALIWSLPKLRVQQLMDTNDSIFLRALQNEFGYRLGKLQTVNNKQMFPLNYLVAQQQIKPGCVLIGNAAHTLHPIAAQGFNLGLRDAAALAEILVDAKRIQRNLGDINLLQTYVDWRKQDQQATLRFTHGITRIFTNADKPLAFLRNIGLVGLNNFPFLKKQFTKSRIGLNAKVPKLACGIKL